MSTPRFHLAPLDAAPGSTVILDGPEGRHAARVVRVRRGDRVVLFDGAGVVAGAEVVGARGERVELVVRERHAVSRELPRPIAIAPAVLKGDAMDALVRDATMLGASAIAPVITTRTVVPASAAASDRAVERWRRIALASAKQCGRDRLPDITPARPLEAALRDEAWREWHRVILCEPAAQADAASPFPAAAAAPVVFLSGPEGGWADAEIAAARGAGWAPWTCSALTLRAETAPVAALAIAGWLAAVQSR